MFCLEYLMKGFDVVVNLDTLENSKLMCLMICTLRLCICILFIYLLIPIQLHIIFHANHLAHYPDIEVLSQKFQLRNKYCIYESNRGTVFDFIFLIRRCISLWSTNHKKLYEIMGKFRKGT